MTTDQPIPWPAVAPASPSASATSISWMPGRGVLSGGIAGVITWLIIVALHHWGLDVPFEIQTLLPPLISSLITYLVPPSARDVVNRLNDQIVQLAAATEGVPVSNKTVVVAGNTPIVQSLNKA